MTFDTRKEISPQDTIIGPYALLAIFMVAIIVRAICLYELKDTHLLHTLVGDAELYDLWAREILETHWLGRGVFFQAPFYPYFMAVIYRFFGESLIVVRVVQMFFGAGSCVLVALTGRYFLSSRVGFLAGLLLALYPIAIFYDLLIQKAVFGLFFTALLLYLLGRTTAVPRAHDWMLAGLALGTLVMVRENALILLPVVLLWLVIHHRQAGWRRISAWAALFICGLALVMLPVGLRNKLVGGEFILTTYNLGFNLYIGNRSEATGTYSALVIGQGDWRFESSDALRLAEKAEGRKLTAAEVSHYWTRMAIDHIGSDPSQWIQLLGKKWALLWNAVEASDTESIYAYRHYSHILSILLFVFHFGVLLPLAAAGVWLSWKMRSRIWLLYVFLLGYAAGIMPFFIFARYRQTMLAVLLPLAAFAIVQGWYHLRSRTFRPLAIALAITMVAGLFANYPLISRDGIVANTYYNWGSVFENEGKIDQAVAYYQRAIRMNPYHALALNNLGVVASNQGDFQTGVIYFEKALNTQPGMAKTHNNLATAFYHLGQFDDALEHFGKVLQENPESAPSVHYNMACVLARMNRVEASLTQLKLAIANGYANRNQLETDRDLDSLRRIPEFQALLKTLPDSAAP
jgi:tetratricopeptide (TPR) repeat protein